MSQFDSGQSSRRDYGTMSGSSGANQMEADTESLCLNVGNAIERIKQNTNALEKTLKGIGTKKDNAQFRESAYDIQKETNEIIAITPDNLGKLTRITRGESKQRRLQVDKFTSDFDFLLKKYSDVQTKMVTKMRRTLLVVEPQDNNEPSTNPNEQLMQQQQLQYQIQVSDSRDREAQMRNIESLVVDVNVVMVKLSEEIHRQGQSIATIESNIVNVQGNVEEGAKELQTAQNYANKYRKKVLILLLIAIIAGAIVTGIVISSVGKNN